jgi:hypothetical protein
VLKKFSKPSFTVYSDPNNVPVMLDIDLAVSLGRHLLDTTKSTSDGRLIALAHKLLALNDQLDGEHEVDDEGEEYVDED